MIWDFQAQDFFYKEAVKRGHGPKSSSRIKYLAINNGTYQYFDKNNLDRRDLAKINQVLVDLSPQTVFYDIIFKRRTNPDADQVFEESVSELGVVYLPMGFSLVDEPREFKQEKGFAYQRLEKMLKTQPIEKGSSQPYHATQSNMHLQYDGFAKAAFNSGHISSPSDSDGVYRHHPLVIKVNNKLLPSISLSIFLDYAQVSFDEVEINWGKEIRIPATKESFLDEDVIVPIDERGRVFIPFAHFWEGEFPQGNDFEKITVQSLLKHSENRNMSGNLAEFFEGNFVFIADFSTGISDTGTTQLEKMVPLVAVHANLVNSFLTNTFYSKWSFNDFARLIIIIGLFFGLAALLKNSKFLYAAGIVVLAGIAGIIWYQNLRFALVPIVSLITGSLIIFVGLVTAIQLQAAKEKAFIQKAFSKYLSPVLVKGLLENPELLRSGGVERVMTVFFADMEGFTPLSEKLDPPELAKAMQEYFTELTSILLDAGGTINQYAGDEVMVCFGAPLDMPRHADNAVKAGLAIHRRLKVCGEKWKEKGLPELKCRIGINTGKMLFGNLGSEQVYYYSVMGDNVNLASRLETANKIYGSYMIISEFTLEELTPGQFKTRLLDIVKVKGKSKAVKIYEVYGDQSDQIDPADSQYYQAYQKAFETYLTQNFAEARELFGKTLQLRPGDLASATMIEHIDSINPEEISPGWDGSIALTKK
jgi:adenylate cyclase